MSLQAFFKQNERPTKTVRYVASDRYTDENGAPMQWEIRVLSSEEENAIKQKAMRTVELRNGRTDEVFDTQMYIGLMSAAATVFPNLNDAALQDDRGVCTARELLLKLLTGGEYSAYAAKVQEVNSYRPTMAENIETAKN